MLTRADLGCWLIKSATPPGGLSPDWRHDEERILTRCLRRSYRLALMHAGDPCLLWVSGRGAGVHAVGRLLHAPTDESVAVVFTLLAQPLLRVDLVHLPALARAEVLRMLAGSNPSYLKPAEHAALVDLGELPGPV